MVYTLTVEYIGDGDADRGAVLNGTALVVNNDSSSLGKMNVEWGDGELTVANELDYFRAMASFSAFPHRQAWTEPEYGSR